MYKIALADDHGMFRAGLKSLIEKDPLFRVTTQAEDGEELLDKLAAAKHDLVLLDLCMASMDGIAALKEIRKRFPDMKVIVLTMQKDHEHFTHAMKHGASGYILKDEAYDQLFLGIKIVLKGKQFISPGISAVVTDRFVRSIDAAESSSLDILTKRERQILELIATGLANKAIASRLKVSIRTVETHRAHLSRKLGINNTAGLVKFAISKGLV